MDKIEETLSSLTASGAVAPEKASEINPSRSYPFFIESIAPIGVESGDGRMFLPGSLSVAELPLPLMWQTQSGNGHDGSVIIGRIDSVENDPEKGLINGRGVIDGEGAYGREAYRLIKNGYLSRISGDFDNFEATQVDSEDQDEMSSNVIKAQPIHIKKATLNGVTCVSKAAFSQLSIKLVDDELSSEEPEELGEDDELSSDSIEPGEYEATDERDTLVASLDFPMTPPRAWFQNPKLTEPTPLTVTDEGQVFGHMALWSVSHLSFPGGNVRPPRSRTDYKYFRTGVVRTDDGTDVSVGQLTLTGGHANTQLSAQEAKKHYDDTMSQMCDVVAGEDEFGIYIAGAMRPDITEGQLRAFRASSISGDWRPINGRLELVACCSVNTPGFPTTRAMVASGGEVQALIAAGSFELNQLKQAQNNTVEERLSRIEADLALFRAKDSVDLVRGAVEERKNELKARVEAAKAILA